MKGEWGMGNGLSKVKGRKDEKLIGVWGITTTHGKKRRERLAQSEVAPPVLQVAQMRYCYESCEFCEIGLVIQPPKFFLFCELRYEYVFSSMLYWPRQLELMTVH